MPDGPVIVVGRIAGSYGVRGWVRVEPFNDPRESVLLTARRWLLQRPTIAPRTPGEPSAASGRHAPSAATTPDAPSLPAWLTVSTCKLHGDALLASLEEIGVKEAAEALRGAEIAVARSEFPLPGQDEFYWVDLIGCTVVTPAGVDLGVVEAVDDHGAHPLLRVRGSDGRERLIPFVSAHVPEVDIRARRIVADWDPDF